MTANVLQSAFGHISFIFITVSVTSLAALVFDIKFGRIPNWITLPVMTAGITYHYCSTGFQGLGLSVAGLLIGFSIFFVFYALGGMGAGDIKLMAALGALLGPKDILFTAAFTAIAGGIYAAILLLAKDNRKALTRYKAMAKGIIMTGHLVYIEEDERITPLRYGAAIAVGAMTALMLRMIH